MNYKNFENPDMNEKTKQEEKGTIPSYSGCGKGFTSESVDYIVHLEEYVKFFRAYFNAEKELLRRKRIMYAIINSIILGTLAILFISRYYTIKKRAPEMKM